MEKRNKIIYRVITGIFTALIMMGVSQYFFNHDAMVEIFKSLEYPSYLIYLLGTVKILGLIAIWTNKSRLMKEWAYAGFFFNLSLAITAHLNVSDGEFTGALMCLVLLVTSYVFNRKVNKADYTLAE